MAVSKTLQVGATYPVGETVYVFQGSLPDSSLAGNYPGTPVGSATVTAQGTVTFTTLQPATSYVLQGLVGGTYKFIEFRTDVASGGLTIDETGLLSDGSDSVVLESSGLQVLKEGPLNVQYPEYGALGDGTSGDGAAIQAAFDAMGAAEGGEVFFPKGLYNTTDQTIVPPVAMDSDTPHTVYSVKGDGAVLKTTAAQPIIEDSTPADTSTATTRTGRKFSFEGLSFVGTATSGQRGLVLKGTYGASIERCTFANLDNGLDLIFCLQASVRDCDGNNNVSRAFRARSGVGVWGDATDANSGANHTTFKSCRDFARSGQTAQFHIFGSSGVVIEDCICEGNNPVDAIKFDANSATVVKAFTVRNLHSENTPSGAIVRALASGGYVEVDTIWTGAGGVIVDASGSNASALVKVKIPYLQGGNAPYFKGDYTNPSTTSWAFDMLNVTGDPTTASYWVGSNVPPNIMSLGFTGALGNVDPMFKAQGNLLVTSASGGVFIDRDTYIAYGSGKKLSTFGTYPGVVKQTVSGSRGGNAALQSLLSALAAYGLITDSSS